MVTFGKICIQGIRSFHGKQVGRPIQNVRNRRSFLKSYDELGDQFENLLSFLEMGTAPSPTSRHK